jgi:phage terminase large subunit-like protein
MATHLKVAKANSVPLAMSTPLGVLDLTDPFTQQVLDAIDYKKRYCKIETYFPAKGKRRRSLYKKQLLHFRQGRTYKQRMFRAGNRSGKTIAAAIEVVFHLTGEYPNWWEGHRYKKPQNWWVCGKNSKAIYDVLQEELLGPIGDFGSGMIPRHLLHHESLKGITKSGVVVTDFAVRHKSGGLSTVGFRTYEQGREAFQGTERCIWLDEEPPLDIYLECLMRTMTRKGDDGHSMIILTFTPLMGMTPLLLTFLEGTNYDEGEKSVSKWVTTAGWEDIPHLETNEKDEMLKSYPESERDARSKGVPSIGEGRVYPVVEDRVFVEPFAIPDFWKRCFAMDFGYKDPTAIIWGAIDPTSDCIYIYAEHYVSEAPPMTHAAAIKTRDKLAGFVIPGVCDPSGGGSSTKDGEHTRKAYDRDFNIRMKNAINSIAPGIAEVLTLLTSDRLKIFTSCVHTRQEFVLYQYNKRGEPHDYMNHIMDCLRYLVMSGVKIAKSLEEDKKEREFKQPSDYVAPWQRHKDAWLYR